MKRIIAERIARLNTLLDNKEAKFMQNKNYANRPFMQGNIINMRLYLTGMQQDLILMAGEMGQRNVINHFRTELDRCERYIQSLEVTV